MIVLVDVFRLTLLSVVLTEIHGWVLVSFKSTSPTKRFLLNAHHGHRRQVHDGDDDDPPMDPSYLSATRNILGRRDFSFGASCVGVASLFPDIAQANVTTMKDHLREVRDPNTYSALSYVDPTITNKEKGVPLIVVLHGAGKNQDGVWSLADIQGEHAGLIPSLIATNKAPLVLADNFAVVAPYAAGKASFYDEPRSKLLKFVDWVCSEEGQKAGCPPNIDPNRIFLFGFSDGATVGVELATTRRFKACIICAYGYSGILPSLALERLKDLPIWVFHSKDDVIFPVSYSDQLVQSLRSVSTPGLVRYTRFEADQEGFTGNVKGHSVGITASKMADIYTWMLSIP